MAKKRADVVRASRAKAGVKSTSVYLTDAQKREWKAIAEARGLTLGETLLAGLNALTNGPSVTKEAVIAWIERNARDDG